MTESNGKLPDERQVQNAVGSLKEYKVTIVIPIVGNDITYICVKAENEEKARERAIEILEGAGVDDSGKDLESDYDNVEASGEPTIYLKEEGWTE